MKKVLSFVLVLSMVLSSFSMAFAGETKTAGLSDIAGNANEEAIRVVNDLGIVVGYTDGEFKAEKAVNRAEFAVMMTKALGIPESALAGYTETKFTDVAGYDWAVPYLAFCESKGIMSGYGNGEVKPGNTITVNEAMAMALRAVGYTPNSAELVGTWPSNYVTKAQDLGLYANVATATTVDRGNAAQIIYNTLTVQKVAVDADGQTQGIQDIKVNDEVYTASMLTTGLNCLPSQEVVDFANHDASLINLTPYVGLWAEVYRNADEEVVAIKPFSTYVTGYYDADENEFVTENKTYKLDGDAESVMTWTTYDIYDNPTSHYARALENFDEKASYASDFNTVPVAATEVKTAFDNEEVMTLAVKISGKTIKTVYSVNVWDDFDVQFADTSVLDEIEDGIELLGEEFRLDEDKEIDTNKFILDGVKSLKDIKEDNVVAIYLNDGKIVRVAVGTEVVNGKVTNHDFKAGTWTVNGKDYGLTSLNHKGDLTELTSTDNFGVTDTVELYLDFDGDVYEAVLVEGVANNYGLVKYFDGKEHVDGYVARVYTTEDTYKTYVLDEDKYPTMSTPSTITRSTADAKELIAYRLNKAGEIDYITKGATATLTSITAKKAEFSAGPDLWVAKDLVVFTHDFDMTTISKLDIDAAGIPVQYLVNKAGDIVALMVYDEDTTKTGDYVYAVFNKANRSDNDDDLTRLYGYANGESLDKWAYAPDSDLEDEINDEQTTSGEALYLYAIKYDADGVIATISALSVEDLDTLEGSDDVFKFVDYATVSAFNVSKMMVETSNGAIKNEVAENALVYKWSEKDSAWTVSKFSNLREEYRVAFYELDNANDGYEVVLFYNPAE